MRRFIAGVLLLHLLLAAGSLAAQERRLYTKPQRHPLPEQIIPALETQLSGGSSNTR
jgi:hypothetical protein